MSRRSELCYQKDEAQKKNSRSHEQECALAHREENPIRKRENEELRIPSYRSNGVEEALPGPPEVRVYEKTNPTWWRLS